MITKIEPTELGLLPSQKSLEFRISEKDDKKIPYSEWNGEKIVFSPDFVNYLQKMGIQQIQFSVSSGNRRTYWQNLLIQGSQNPGEILIVRPNKLLQDLANNAGRVDKTLGLKPKVLQEESVIFGFFSRFIKMLVIGMILLTVWFVGQNYTNKINISAEISEIEKQMRRNAFRVAGHHKNFPSLKKEIERLSILEKDAIQKLNKRQELVDRGTLREADLREYRRDRDDYSLRLSQKERELSRLQSELSVWKGLEAEQKLLQQELQKKKKETFLDWLFSWF